MRLAVTGTHGQLVTSLVERGAAGGVEIIPVGRPALDLSQPQTVFDALRGMRCDAIVSAAAYTAVDKAESETELAMTINGDGAGAVAAAADALGVPVLHVSTDYVFDGTGSRAYRESDPVGPAGAYGRSKLAGEQAVAAACANHVILRTAWVYSPFGANFVKTMLRLAGDRDSVSVVADQRGNPSNALDLADAIVQIARNLADSPEPALRGVFHMTAQGEASWAEFAAEIFAQSTQLGGPSAQVVPITTADYPTPARRPANSVLDCTRLADRHGVTLPHWRESLPGVIARLVPSSPTHGA